MALCESSCRRMRRQKALQKTVVFISANTTGAGQGYKQQSTKAIHSHNKDYGGPDKNLELLILRDEQAYSACDFRG